MSKIISILNSTAEEKNNLEIINFFHLFRYLTEIYMCILVSLAFDRMINYSSMDKSQVRSVD